MQELAPSVKTALAISRAIGGAAWWGWNSKEWSVRRSRPYVREAVARCPDKPATEAKPHAAEKKTPRKKRPSPGGMGSIGVCPVTGGIGLALTSNGPVGRTPADRMGEGCPTHRLQVAACFGPDLSKALSPPGTLPGAAQPLATLARDQDHERAQPDH